jgi:hypothetical protein
MALALQMPELALDDSMARQYAEAVAMVARHYDIGASAKALDWGNLVSFMGGFYGAAAMTAIARKKGGAAYVNGAGAPHGREAAGAESGISAP